MRKYYIYKITNKLNGKCYIGQHLIPEKGEQFRWYMGRGTAIQNALKKYGRKNFDKQILEYLEDNEQHLKVSEREIYWIKYYDTMYPNGYNLTPGGEGGCTKEAAAKGVQTRKQKGYRHSQNTKDKISKANTGKPKSKIHRQHLSDNHHTKSIKTIVFEDGHTEDTVESLMSIMNRFNIKSFNKLIRYSANQKFINGIYILGIYGDRYACTKSYKGRLKDCLCQDPIKGDICRYQALQTRKCYGKNKHLYENIDIKQCVIKKGESNET